VKECIPGKQFPVIIKIGVWDNFIVRLAWVWWFYQGFLMRITVITSWHLVYYIADTFDMQNESTKCSAISEKCEYLEIWIILPFYASHILLEVFVSCCALFKRIWSTLLQKVVPEGTVSRILETICSSIKSKKLYVCTVGWVGAYSTQRAHIQLY
jgi:hypothetical protein